MQIASIEERFTLGDLADRHRPGFKDEPRVPYMCTDHLPRFRVLCFSRDRILGESRNLVLQRQYEAVYVGSLEEFAALSSGPAFDAVVLCHSLSAEEYERCIEIAELLWPRAKIVSVVAGSGRVQLESAAVVPGLAGPRALLLALQRVLQPIHSGVGPT